MKEYYKEIAKGLDDLGCGYDRFLTRILKEIEDGTYKEMFMGSSKKDPWYEEMYWNVYRFVRWNIIDKIDWIWRAQAWKHWWQRRTQGWDDSVTWNLDARFYEWMAPRFKRFRFKMENIMPSVPSYFFTVEGHLYGEHMGIPQVASMPSTRTDEGDDNWKFDDDWKEWQRCLNEIEWALDFANNEYSEHADDWAKIRFQNGMRCLTNNMHGLWW